MFTADLFERVVRTAVVSFWGAFSLAMSATLASGLQWSVSWWEAAVGAAALAGVNAVGTAVLALVTKMAGPDKSTASMLPPASALDVPSTVTSVTTYPPTVPEPITDHAA